jgi:hypothetical protein
MSDTTNGAPAINTADAPKVGDAWGDTISEKRQRDLDTILAAWVAAIESVVGIVIEGVFVAMLIQRLFR